MLLPNIPLAYALTIRHSTAQGALRTAPPYRAVRLAAIALARHQFTGYDAMLQQGYDRDAARFFVQEDMCMQLQEWGLTIAPNEFENIDGDTNDTPQ